MQQRNLFILILLFLLFSKNLLAQPDSVRDTISLTLPAAENLFLQKNFLLLAAKYQVSISDAAIIQAKLYPNPNFFIEQGAYNAETGKAFDLSSKGETSLTLQQVIILAGKRNKQINIARMNSRISTYQFYDLIRTLRYELRSAFYGLYFLREPIAVYDREIESLKTLIDVYNAQYNKGNIAFKDLARLQALQFSLQNERLDLMKEVTEKQADLILLTGDTLSRPIQPAIDSQFIKSIDVNNLNYTQLLDSALVNRYDLRTAHAQVELNETNLALQKSLRVPDLTLGLNYDKAGSYVHDYNSVSIAIDLPCGTATREI